MKALPTSPMLPSGWNAFADMLKSYIAHMRPRIDEIYDYSFFTPEDFSWDDGTQAEKNVALRQHYHRKWKIAAERGGQATKEELAREYIVNFGGIRKNSAEKITRYATATDAELAEGKLDGVASWSKVLSIRDPLSFAIYDARVAFSLNALQVQELGQVRAWFPLLPTQNATLARVQQPFAAHKPNAEDRLKSGHAYRCYMKALRHAVGSERLDDGEMVLFAVAPALAKQWEAAHVGQSGAGEKK